MSEPVLHFGLKKVGKMNSSRPHSGNQSFSIFFFYKIILFATLFIGFVALFHFYAGINDGHQMDMAFPHFFHKVGKMREAFGIYGKILIALHIINIEVDGVERYRGILIARKNRANVFFAFVTPSTLPETEGPFRRNIALPCNSSELSDNFIGRICSEAINIRISGLGTNDKPVELRVADIKTNGSRIIYENPFHFFLFGRSQEDKVL